MSPGAIFRALGLGLIWVVTFSPGFAQDRVARLGVVVFSEATTRLPWMVALTPRLRELGWVEGKNLQIEYRYASGDPPDYSAGVIDLLARNVDVIYCLGAPQGRAAASATKTIPIVMQDYTSDPVALGWAVSYGQPGRNITGVFLDAPDLAGKWLQMLREMVPGLNTVAVLWDPTPGRNHRDTIVRIAQREGLKTDVHEVRSPADFEGAFRRMRGKSQALVILPSPITYTYGRDLAALALKYKMPATNIANQFANLGGAISYGPNITESTLRNAEQIAKILGGAKPGSIPIERPFKYDFLINTKTVKALNLRLPEHLMVGAELVQ